MWDMELPEKNRGSNFSDISYSNIFLDQSPKPRETKVKINYWDSIKIKSFYTAKETRKQNKTKQNKQTWSIEWEKMFANDISDKGFISKIHKKFIQLSNNKKPQTILLKIGQRFWIDMSLKKTSRWPTDKCKDVHHHSSWGKCKSKPRWDTTSHRSEGLKSETQQTSAGDEVEKKAPHTLLVGMQPPWKAVWRAIKTWN